MNPWLETIGVILVAVLGVVLGRCFSRLKRPYWMLGYFPPCLLILTLVVARCVESLAFISPFYWVTGGRAKFVILAFSVTMGLTTPFSRLPRKCEKVIICGLMTLVVFWFSVLPFLVPGLIKGRLSGLRTRVDLDGVCYQTTEYTCAPAAAVTALKKLGFVATEGEIAILAHTSPVAGTLPGCLQAALESRYGSQGLRCHYRRFQSIEELKQAGMTLAVVKDAFLTDHCVAVLEVSDHTLLVADPAVGRQMMSHEQFESIWRHTGIVLEKERPEND